MTSLEYDELCSNNHKIKNLYHSVLSHDTAVVMCNSLDKLTFKKFVQSTLDPFTFRKWALDNGFVTEMSELHCWAQLDPKPFTAWVEMLLTMKINAKHERVAVDPNAEVKYFNNSIRRLSKICMEAFSGDE